MPVPIADHYADIARRMKELGLKRDAPEPPDPKPEPAPVAWEQSWGGLGGGSMGGGLAGWSGWAR